MERRYTNGRIDVTITPIYKGKATRGQPRTVEADGGDAARSCDEGAKRDADPPRDRDREGGERAARVVRRTALASDMCDMYTLTFPAAGVHDYQLSYELVAGYIRDTSAGAFIRGRGYIAVPEPHPGGHGWHWHILMPGGRCPRRMLKTLRDGWTAYLWEHHRPAGWNGGNVRSTWTHKDTSLEAANYAAKYITKTFLEGCVARGRHRYLVSKGLRRPEISVRKAAGPWSLLLATGNPHRWTYCYEGSSALHLVFFVAFDPPPPT